MARIDELIEQIENSELRERIEAELKRANKQKKFGLVFEDHVPECTPLYDVPIKKGSLVARHGEIKTIYRVFNIDDGKADCVEKYGEDRESIPLDELVCIAEFGDPIYPYLQPVDSVCNAPDSDLWHTLIEADNYHALQLLDYLYHGKVDCIYIDPPYNTGAKDWKYNNNYVDKSDNYKHSKWLSMMEKRLKLAKKLLNPKGSVLIVTIDEKEYLHLGCLLEELFPEATIQMVDSIINRKGVSHKGMGSSDNKRTLFSRVSEYIYFVMFGDFSVSKSTCNMLDTQTTDENDDVQENVSWLSMLRRGSASMRADKPKHFYPIFVNPQKAEIVSVGEPLDIDVKRQSVCVPEGLVAIWPMRTNGSEGRWQLKKETFESYLEKGYAKLGTYNKKSDRWAINYLNQGLLDEIAKHKIAISGKDEKGALILKRTEDKLVEPKSVWNQTSHNASEYGTTLLNNVIGESRFSYPKSLYAIKDAIRICTTSKKNALILDFFAGSGTSLHAVNLLNAEDGGHRRCIMVTNNEVSDTEATILANQGFTPADKEWQNLGIARYVNWPRTVCSIKGENVAGAPLVGTYLNSKRLMSDGFAANAAFFRLSFLDKNSVALGTQLQKLIPVLWMKAGAIGECPSIDDQNNRFVFPANKFAILIDTKYAYEFTQEVAAHDIQVAYIVTDYEPEYREIAKGLNVPTTYHLYRDYLDNFSINTGRA